MASATALTAKEAGASPAEAPASFALPQPRRASIDAYRGFVMLLMLMECLHLWEVKKHVPDAPWAEWLAFHTTHVAWNGCSLHDMIQPSFSFLVGVALSFSVLKRKETGEPWRTSAIHAALRSLLLIWWGILLRSLGDDHRITYFTFEDTLTQIGLGYFALFLLSSLGQRWLWAAFAAILVGTWSAFVLYQPPADFSFERVGVPADWPEHATGWAAHWNKNANLAWAADLSFLNAYPRQQDFEYNSGGYATLSFVPTLATMLLGLIAGHWLRGEPKSWQPVIAFVAIGAVLLGAGRALNDFSICPIVKRVWSPSWVLFSGGWCFLILAAFHAATDAIGLAGWSYPLRVIGSNSILIYTIAELPLREFLNAQFTKHLPKGAWNAFGPQHATIFQGAVWLVCCWLLLWWLHRKKLFLRL